MYTLLEGDEETFTFKIERKTYKLPRITSLPFRKFRKFQERVKSSDNKNEEAIDCIFGLFEEYIPDALDKMTFAEVAQLAGDYAANNGDVALGESSTSSD